MVRASTFLTDAERAAVERAIAEAETTTSAEIVVALASRSGRYDRAEDTFGLLLALLAVALSWIIWQQISPNPEPWSTGQTVGLGLIPALVIFAAWSVVGAALATSIPALARPFIPRLQREAEVRRRGVEAFHLFRVGQTTGHSGMLIYVSILERMAWVVGDDAIAAKLPQSTWDEATKAITDAVARGEHAAGLTRAVDLCAKALAVHFPRDPADKDELPNLVHVLD